MWRISRSALTMVGKRRTAFVATVAICEQLFLALALLWCVALINATRVAAQIAPVAGSVSLPAPTQAPKAAIVPATTTSSTGVIVSTTSIQPKSAETAKADSKPAESAKTIALVLPLSSKTLGKAAEAVRAGFIAAAEVSGKEKFAHRIYLAEDEGTSLAILYRKAVAEGAVAIVAGVTRDGATVVAREAGYLPTLAVNTPIDLAMADANNFFHMSLSLDWDAKLVARAATQEGFRNVAILFSNASSSGMLSRRIQDSFEKEWMRLGGTIAARVGFSGDLTDGGKVKSAMEKAEAAKAEAVFIAADMQSARFARTYLPQGLPVFATAQTIEPGAGAVENLDLESVKYLEMPWFAERDHAAVMSYPRPPEGTPVDYERLYALGIDAWRIIVALLTANNDASTGSNVDRLKRSFAPIDGVTGRITLDGNQFFRGLTLLEMRDGRPQLVKSAE
ncbi:MAG: penicillin-binding protein activator [Pseudomonadota bacterium]